MRSMWKEAELGFFDGVLFELSDTEQGREIYLSFILNKGYGKVKVGEVRQRRARLSNTQ